MYSCQRNALAANIDSSLQLEIHIVGRAIHGTERCTCDRVSTWQSGWLHSLFGNPDSREFCLKKVGLFRPLKAVSCGITQKSAFLSAEKYFVSEKSFRNGLYTYPTFDFGVLSTSGLDNGYVPYWYLVSPKTYSRYALVAS